MPYCSVKTWDVTFEDGFFQKFRGRFEAHLLKGWRTILHSRPVEASIPATRRHVGGNQRQVADIYADTVSGEDVANFLQEKNRRIKMT